MKPTVAIIGCGTVGTAIGKLLARSGYPITGVASRHLDTARTAAPSHQKYCRLQETAKL